MSVNIKEEEKREQFRTMLFDLSKSESLFRNANERVRYYKLLEDIYAPDSDGNKFKHYYSDIFSVLTEIHQNSAQNGNINVLGQNVENLKRNYRAKTPDTNGNLIDVSDQIRKLYDHLSLDIARINYSDKGDDNLSQETKLHSIESKITELSRAVQSTKSQSDEINEKLDITQKAVQSTKSQSDEVNEKLDNAQKEYIAILGIFSAVVLAFTAGIAFSSSVLQNMHSSSIYRILIVSLTVGLVTVNIIYLLFDFIVTMTRSRHTKEKPKKWTWLIINGIILLLMFCVTVAWLFGVSEKRMQYVENTVKIVKTEETKTS